MNKSKIIDAMLKTASDLSFNRITIKEIESLHINEVKALDSYEIKNMRVKEKISQAVMAKILNVTPSTYQKWERGESQPKGANLKLLRIAHDHGIQYIFN